MNEPPDYRQSTVGFVHIGAALHDVLKEVQRRAELRARLTAEWEREPTDGELLEIVKHGGLML